jgi:hypothetical protein
MLRPASSLPPLRLLTPRSGHGSLPSCPGPATRRSGTYQGGTSTRWIGSARKRFVTLGRMTDALLRTHHDVHSAGAVP